MPSQLFDPVIGTERGSIHIVISTDCYHSSFIYQSLALNYTFNKVKQPGQLTRLLSCRESDVEKILQEDLDIMDTLLVPDWSTHPKTGDYYPLYNRPISLIFWLADRKPKAEWTLILHPDMMLRQQITISDFNLPEHYAASSHYNYLIGVKNDLVVRHLPHAEQRKDLYAGPKTRRADQAGPFIFIRTRDLIKVVPQWLRFTEKVRGDLQSWDLTGDVIMESGRRSWLAEMYGYVFAAANVSVWHKVDPLLQSYPGLPVKDVPSLIHYGLSHTLGSFSFDKKRYSDFDAFQCPPWNLEEEGVGKGGLFPHPPSPKMIKESEIQKKYGYLLIIEFANNLNKALCLRHRQKCGESEQLTKECGMVDQLDQELEQEFNELHKSEEVCQDDEVKCKHWMEDGECEKNWLYMIYNCRQSCGKCKITHHTISHTSRNRTYVNEETKADLEIQNEDKEKEFEMQRVLCLRLGRQNMLSDPRCHLLARNGALTPPLSSSQQLSQSLGLGKNPLLLTFGLLCIKATFFVVFCLGVVFLVLKSNRTFSRSKSHSASKIKMRRQREKRLL